MQNDSKKKSEKSPEELKNNSEPLVPTKESQKTEKELDEKELDKVSGGGMEVHLGAGKGG